MINKLAIIGVGLIGGSLAKALKTAGYVKHISGYGRSLQNLKKAKKLGIIDAYSLDILEVVKKADIVVIATPIRTFKAILTSLAPALGTQTLITDVASVKVEVMRLAATVLADKFGQFIATHPIAGKEKSGIEAADGQLFTNKTIILTPNQKNPPEAIKKVQEMWQAVGGIIKAIPAVEHDKILAATSHLPHILAFVLMDYLFAKQDDIYQYIAGGFRDFSRIASSDATMWRDICLSNKVAITDSIDGYQKKLSELKTLINQEDAQCLYDLFSRAKQNRDSWLEDFDNNG